MTTRIQKNSYHVVTIDSLSDKAQGWGRIDGFPVVIDGALAGETLEIKLIKVTTHFAVGKLLQVLKPSSERIRAFCPVFGRCGGCTLQHMRYESQLAFKSARLDQLFRETGLIDTIVHPILGMNAPVHYRNKALYPVGMKQGVPQLGFYASYSHEIIEHDACRIHLPIVDQIRAFLREFLQKHRVSIYDERCHHGLLRHVLIRVSRYSGDVMMVLVINGSTFPALTPLVKQISVDFPEIKSLVLNENTQQGNVISGQINKVVYGSESIRDRLGNYDFDISASSFYQVNSLQTETLCNTVLSFAGLTGSELLFDLYCGVGSIAIFLAQHARKVYGVEIHREAVQLACRNVVLNSSDNVTILQGEAGKTLENLAAQGVHADVIVIDPPRKGCSESLLKCIAAMQTKRIIYVSCNPSTLVRDLAFLAQKNFRVAEVQAVDMFPHTLHIECIARIERI
ncbi:23S rRNA (uracil(1939)-C(5))-methyltransferase RlmD [candidate division KSB3 bacterium]|nr:MAG: 23S rRNA (uracil(1939)-C(5))-methyltransferase RlmD [candidate division KSB3 bacterium]